MRALRLAGACLVFVAVFVAAGRVGAIESMAREAFLMDLATESVLMEKNADTPMAPASMSKLMTVYMILERLQDGQLSLDDTFSVSENAWRKGGAKSGSSTMFLNPGSRVRIEDLLRGIIVQSGNDASIVIAESLSGSEEQFALEMNLRARKLGLEQTHFVNATGWPDPEHRTTARDLARLAKRTITDFPQYHHYYAEKTFTYNGIRQGNRNPLLYKDLGADGMKTGHTQESGYGLVATVKRGERRLILVINGLPSIKARARESERLIERGYREFENYALFKAGEKVIDADVWLGTSPTVPLYIENGMLITLPRKARRAMKVSVTYEGPIPAPFKAGDRLARLTVTAPGADPIEVPLVAAEGVERLGFLGRLGTALKSILWGVTG
jgi:serine-type D-Ala-D-Ala carboxypeptidase (penicillin-binding protein 5/6)